MTSHDPRYPIGRFTPPPAYSAESVRGSCDAIHALPDLMRAAVDGLSDTQLDTPYREGGWTLRQTLHHVADSHLNAYVRTRLAVTEESPRILPYKEAEWAKLPDASRAPVDCSLTLLDGLHVRWAWLLSSFDEVTWQRTFVHPQHPAPFTLWSMAALYAWHGRHHLAHITTLRDREGW